RACLERESWCAEVSVLQTVVGGIWGDEVWKDWLAVALDGPVEFAAVDDDATDGGAVAGVELGGRCNNDVSPKLQRACDRSGSDGVVHNQWHLVVVRNLCNCWDVQDVSD